MRWRWIGLKAQRRLEKYVRTVFGWRWSTDVYASKAYGCYAYIQIGTLGNWFGAGSGKYGWRLELFTPYHYFRFCRSKPKEAGRGKSFR